MLDGDCGSPPLLPAEDVVRSVFELGGRRLSIFEVEAVLDVVRGVLTKGSNPVQEESISSSSSPSPSPSPCSSSFWFLLSSTGTVDHVSDSCQPLLGFRPTELRTKSAYTVVASRDHHILPPIIHVGPCTSMTCRLHLQTAFNQDAPFDVTFAKLSTRQLEAEAEKERSTTLCIARSVPVSHGKITFSLDSSFRVLDVENKSQFSLDSSHLTSRLVSELVAKTDTAVLDTLLEAQSECSAQLSLSLPGLSAVASVRSVHLDGGNVLLHCDLTKIDTNVASPVSDPSPTNVVSVVSNGDPLSQLCSTIFTEDMGQAGTPVPICTSPNVPQTTGTPTQEEPVVEKPKRVRKPRPKKTKAPPEKDACLKKLLATRPPEIPPETASSTGDYAYIDMYQASTMSAPPMYMNNNMNPMGYQPNQCTSYMPGAMCPGGEYGMPQQSPMVPWGPDYYSPTQQQQVPYVPTAPTKTSLKRKPASTPERPTKMPYQQNPSFAFQQAGSVMEPAMSTMPDDYHLQPMNDHLSPFRYSPGSSPYWPPGGRPPSRSEMIRMELRNSLQAKQMANQQRHPTGSDENGVPAALPTPTEAPRPSIAVDALGFDIDIVLKDADGSLMESELDTVYDFNLASGCGFQFDMENESTKCLVMKLLS